MSLSPAHTDLLTTLGAGATLVGTITNPTGGARHEPIASVGSVAGLDYERIVALTPDLIVAWHGGTPGAWIEKLRSLGLTVFVTRTETLDDIGASLRALGKLVAARNDRSYEDIATLYELRLQQLRTTFGQSGAKPVAVFYQVWHQPLMTINRHHIIADAIRSCGARNVFDGNLSLVPQVSTEAVVAARPELIVTARPGARASDQTDLSAAGLSRWQRLTQIPAVRQRRFVVLDADQMTRPIPSMLDAVQRLCVAIANVRATPK